ncbi:MAG TPA: hypothetical protein VIE63_16530, partial [Ramlibacter sp.]
MTGIHDENDTGGTRQPPHVLAAWIRDQVADLNDGQVRRLAELQVQLQVSAFDWDAPVLSQSVASLRAAGRELRLDDLRHGWLARQLGKHKPAYERFAAAHERIMECAQSLKSESAQLATAYKPHAAALKRILLELQLDCKMLQTEVERGVTWLQDMCLQINAQRQEGGARAQLAPLAQAAQAYTQEFKRLEAIAGIARDLGVRMQGLLDRRAALLDMVKRDSEKFDNSWARVVGKIAAGVEAGRESIPGTGPAAEEHDQF